MTMPVREWRHRIFGTRALTEREIIRRLERTTAQLEELNEMVTDWFEENEFPVDDGYVDAPGFVWTAFMGQCDVQDSRDLLAAYFAYYDSAVPLTDADQETTQ